MQVDLRDAGSIPGLDDPLEEGTAAHYNILVWRIPLIEKVAQSWTRLSDLAYMLIGRL